MTDAAPLILIVEDEPQIRRFVRAALESERYRVAEAATLAQGLAQAGCGSQRPSLVILDLGLPDGDGTTFVREFRTWSRAPVIVLSARTDESDKVTALDAGADDYLVKPFSVGELAARVRAGIRRAQGGDQGGEQGGASVFPFGDVVVDFSARRVQKAGAEVHLTPIEYRLISVLIANAGRVLTHRTLLREVWGPSHSDRTHYLRVYMGLLRQKLETEPARPVFILTEPGVGYRLRVEPQAAVAVPSTAVPV